MPQTVDTTLRPETPRSRIVVPPGTAELVDGFHLVASPPCEGKSWLARELASAFQIEDRWRDVYALVDREERPLPFPQWSIMERDGLAILRSCLRNDPHLILFDCRMEDEMFAMVWRAAEAGCPTLAVIEAIDGFAAFRMLLDTLRRRARDVSYGQFVGRSTLTTVRRRFCRWRDGPEVMTETVRLHEELFGRLAISDEPVARSHWLNALEGHGIRSRLGLEGVGR